MMRIDHSPGRSVTLKLLVLGANLSVAKAERPNNPNFAFRLGRQGPLLAHLRCLERIVRRGR